MLTGKTLNRKEFWGGLDAEVRNARENFLLLFVSQRFCKNWAAKYGTNTETFPLEMAPKGTNPSFSEFPGFGETLEGELTGNPLLSQIPPHHQ